MRIGINHLRTLYYHLETRLGCRLIVEGNILSREDIMCRRWISLGEFSQVVEFLRLDLADSRARICTIAVISTNEEPYREGYTTGVTITPRRGIGVGIKAIHSLSSPGIWQLPHTPCTSVKGPSSLSIATLH
jgi:hypothetical protein